jgi:hypothetical protein
MCQYLLIKCSKGFHRRTCCTAEPINLLDATAILMIICNSRGDNKEISNDLHKRDFKYNAINYN